MNRFVLCRRAAKVVRAFHNPRPADRSQAKTVSQSTKEAIRLVKAENYMHQGQAAESIPFSASALPYPLA